MQTFYVVIKKDYLILYEKQGDSFEKIYLNGNPEYMYSINNAKESIERFLSMILEEYNMESVCEMDLIVIENENEIVTERIIKALGQNVKERVGIEKLLAKILQILDRDKKMHISEYGVNFDGKKYEANNNKLTKTEFSLLAYSLNEDLLIKYVG